MNKTNKNTSPNPCHCNLNTSSTFENIKQYMICKASNDQMFGLGVHRIINALPEVTKGSDPFFLSCMGPIVVSSSAILTSRPPRLVSEDVLI